LKERINLNLYIPYYRFDKEIKNNLTDEVLIKGDRDIHFKVLEIAIMRELEKIGIDPKQDAVYDKPWRGNKKRKRIQVKMFHNTPRVWYIVIRMPEAGFSFQFYRKTVKIFLDSNVELDDPYEIFVRDYLKQIEYPKVMEELFNSDLVVRNWVIEQYKKVKKAEQKRLTTQAHYAKRKK
jgi:hypothetical protein